MKWWEGMSWSYFFECWVLSLFSTLLFHLHQKPLYFLSAFYQKGSVNCISEAIDISPSNPDSSLCFIQLDISHDILWYIIYHMIYLLLHLIFCLFGSTLFSSWTAWLKIYEFYLFKKNQSWFHQSFFFFCCFFFFFFFLVSVVFISSLIVISSFLLLAFSFVLFLLPLG